MLSEHVNHVYNLPAITKAKKNKIFEALEVSPKEAWEVRPEVRPEMSLSRPEDGKVNLAKGSSLP